MKKVFTSISLALSLIASSFSTSAQTVQLSEAQKIEIQKEVLPVVFEQIKEQTGLDILGLARPQLNSDFIQSLPVFNAQSGLRSDSPTPYSVKPDSIIVNVAALAPDVSQLMTNVKVLFGDYKKIDMPIDIAGLSGSIEIPRLIKVTSNSILPTFQNIAEIKIVANENPKALLDMDMIITLWGDDTTTSQLIGLTIAQNESFDFEFNVEIGEGLQGIWGLLKAVATLPELPEMNYLITLGFSQIGTGVIPASLYGIPTADATTRIPMGDAAVALDFSTDMPIKYIALTSYENAKAEKWSKLWFEMEQKTTEDLVLTIDNFVYTDEAKTDSTFANRTIVTMSDYTKNAAVASTQSAVKSVINRVVSELATEGHAAWYKMLIESAKDLNGDGNITNEEKATTMEIEVTPSLVGTDAIADINIKSYSYSETGDATLTEMNVKATANLTNNVIRVDLIPAGSPAAVGSAYFTSNIAGIVTSNDDITINTVKVTPVEGGIYIDNSGKAAYRIVNMSGATVANGTVSGDNAYISTSSLAKGVYVIVVTENGVSQSVKFVR